MISFDFKIYVINISIIVEKRAAYNPVNAPNLNAIEDVISFSKLFILRDIYNASHEAAGIIRQQAKLRNPGMIVKTAAAKPKTNVGKYLL
ncbi:MAG: hypothetical protein STSR0008_03990 [Ignavibacterium sp.]